ncbi:PAS domain-containing protein [archaeon]|nr:PAS domain-containing protein [archaeon]
MTPVDEKTAIMNRLLEEMTYLGRRLDDIQNQASKNWEVIETLSAENRLYRDILESLAERYFIKDERLCFILCSKRFASDLRKTVDEVIGNVEENLVPAELAKIRRQQEMRILQSGQAEKAEEILVIDGQQRTFITIRTPLTNGNGSVAGIFGVTVDIGIRGGES